MEDLVTAFNLVLNFVNSVQYGCDQRRIVLENTSNKEFQQYVKEWIRKEEERKQKEEKERKEEENVKVIQENLEALELEEITMADDLLRKARLIREKFKVPSLDEFSEEINKTLVRTTSRVGLEFPLKDVSSNKSSMKNLKQSTSMPSINSNRIIITNSSKSRQTKDLSKIRNTLPRHKCLKTTKNTSVVTKEQLNSYLHNSSKPTSKKGTITLKTNFSKFTNYEERSSGGNKTSKTHLELVQKSVISSFPTQDKYQPTYRDFLNFKSECQNFLHIDLSQSLWYPFLNSSNVSRLTSTIKCRSANEVQQVCSLLHHIQEIVFWLDLFHLIETEITPKLMSGTSTNQKDMTVIQSYIQSIFHPKLHKKPVILSSNME